MSALRTISLRLRGTSVKVLEELGEETDGAVESVSKMQEKLKALTGVDILTDSGAYKDTYTILKEIAEVWESMDPMDQAAALELMAGKNRANTLAAILGNMEDLEGAYNDALKAEGSAMRENERYLESVQGHIDTFNNSLQTMWMNFLNTDAIKWFIHLGDALIKLIDNAGVLQTILTSIGGIWLSKNFGGSLFGGLETTKNNLEQLKETAKVAESIWMKNPSDKNKKVFDDAKENLEAYEAKLKEVDATTEAVGDTTQTSGKKMSGAFSKVGKQLTQLAKSMAIMYAISSIFEVLGYGISLATEHFKENGNSVEALNDKYQEATDKLSDCESELRSLESELDTVNGQIETLEIQGSLTYAEQEELERLQGISAELERQISLKKTLQDSLQAGVNEKAINAANAYLDTSFDSDKSKTDRQKEAEESGTKIGDTIGTLSGPIITSAMTALGTKLAGVASSALLSKAGGAIGSFFGGPMGTLAGIAVGSAVGKLVGGWVGSASEGVEYDQEQKVSEAIENMKEERGRLEKAANDAYEAHIASSDDKDKADAYTSAAQALSLYDEKLAEHINTLSQYYNSVDWDTADDFEKEEARKIGAMIDKYAIEMNAAGAKVNALDRIFGENASEEIQAIEDQITEAVKNGQEFDFGKAVESSQELKDTLEYIGLDTEDVKDYFTQIGEEAKKAQEATSILSDLASTLDSIQSKYDTLQGAIDEFNERGAISGETLKSLIDNNLLQYLTFTENGLIADANAMQMLEQAAINEAYAMLNAAMVQDMENYALGKTEQMSALAQNAIGLAGSAAANAGAQAAQGAQGFLTFASAVAQAGIIDPGNLTAGLQEIYNAYQNIGNAIGHTSAYRPSDAYKSAAGIGGGGGSSSNSAKEIDWIEHYYTEIENRIDELNARLENKISNVQALDAKNTIIDQIIDLYDQKQQKLANAVATYDARADYLFSTFSSDIQNKINNGSLDISSIKDEKLTSNIDEYYDYIEAASKARVEAEELKQTIADLAKQKFDNISTAYENEIGLVDAYIDALQDQIDATEARGEQVGASYYEGMIDSAEKRKQSLAEERNALQASLDEAVKLGQVEVNSDTWYEMVNAIYEVDSAIVEAETSMEEWQTAINDLHWEHFDKLVDKLENISDELDNIYERLTDNDEAFDENGNWTNQGIAALGILTQKMEQAQFTAQQYAEQIDKLNTDYAAGKYSEQEYNEKLAELTEAQWESIEAYEAAKDEIVDLNKARVDAVKDGMQKELDAYKELIDAKKESLEADKKAHEWANSIAEKEKNISDIQRKLAALASDNSTSANAQKKKLQAELLKAQAELEEAYYDKSIEDQQDALDKEYENYEENQQKEIDSLEEWLDDREAVIQDSFDLVKENTKVIYDELLNLSQEYGIQISDEIIAPWLAGKDAIGEYKDAFTNPELSAATSEFMSQLDSMKTKWEETASAAEDAANKQIAEIDRITNATIAAQKEIEDILGVTQIGSMNNVGYDDSDSGGGGGGSAGWSDTEEEVDNSKGNIFKTFGLKLRQAYENAANKLEASLDDFVVIADDATYQIFGESVPETYQRFLQNLDDSFGISTEGGVIVSDVFSGIFASESIPNEYKTFLDGIVSGLAECDDTEGRTATDFLSYIFASEDVPQEYKDFLTQIIANLDTHVTNGQITADLTSKQVAEEAIPEEFKKFLDGIVEGIENPIDYGTGIINGSSEASIGNIINTIDGIFANAAAATVNEANNQTPGMFTKIGERIDGLVSTINSWIQGIIDSVSGVFGGGSSTHKSSSGRSHGGRGSGFANGTANANGTAYADGNWGAPKTETALGGELGTELLVRNGHWTMIGQNGAEFFKVKKGDIIFNHEQTEQLLKHGHVTGRGKAYASGTWKSVSNNLDDLGEELTMCVGANGSLQFLPKDNSVVASDFTARIMEWGSLDPSMVLEQASAHIGTPSIATTNNNNITINENIASLITVEHLDGNNPAEIAKLVDKAWEKKMQTLNNSIKKFTR